MELLRESACDCLSEIINKGTVIYRSAAFLCIMKKSWLGTFKFKISFFFRDASSGQN